MRTRLDQILDHELARAPGGEARMTMPYGAVKRALERAFRHGVEQTVADQENHGIAWNRLRVSTVQPAPAGEKCWCGWSGNHAHEDRRKGFDERRKLPTRTRWMETVGLVWFGKGYRDTGLERRSSPADRRNRFYRCPSYHCYQRINHPGPCPPEPTR